MTDQNEPSNDISEDLDKKIWNRRTIENPRRSQPESLGKIIGSLSDFQDDKSTPFEVGERVYWYKGHRDIPGWVEAVRDGKVLVRLTKGGAWTGTSRWISPTNLRKYGEDWNPTMSI